MTAFNLPQISGELKPEALAKLLFLPEKSLILGELVLRIISKPLRDKLLRLNTKLDTLYQLIKDDSQFQNADLHQYVAELSKALSDNLKDLDRKKESIQRSQTFSLLLQQLESLQTTSSKIDSLLTQRAFDWDDDEFVQGAMLMAKQSFGDVWDDDEDLY